MIGDRLVIYNERTGEFFAGRNYRRVYAYRKSPAIWTKTLDRARLASRVSDLRKLGHPIISERVDGLNKFGEPCHWARYRMGARA